MSAAAQRPVLTFPQRNENFKTILALDGGGLRGVLCAGLLEGVEDAIKSIARKKGLTGIDPTGKEVKVELGTEFDVILGDYFDVVAGTSTGSILATYVSSKGINTIDMQNSPGFTKQIEVAAGVKANVAGIPKPNVVSAPAGSATAAQALFLSQASNIFPPRNCWQKFLAKFKTPRYPAKYGPNDSLGLESVLRSAFGGENVYMTSSGPDGKPLLKTSLIITSYQLDYDRPFIFYYDRPDGVADGEGTSGYGTLRRTLTKDQQREMPPAALVDRGASDLVRVEKPFRLWQTVRASTAAPTLFPTAALDNLVVNPNTNQPVVDTRKPTYQMTDGGVVANNPTLVATTFAATKYETAFVGEPAKGKPSLAVLSLGCGVTSELSNVDPNAGPWGWAVTGPLVDILLQGAGELSAALNQQLARDWPGNKPFQLLRVQLTGGKDEEQNETISFSTDVVTLPPSGSSNVDPHAAPFVRALQTGNGNERLKANDVLKGIDGVGQKNQLLGLGYAVACDHHVKDKLETWVDSFLF